MKQGVSRWAVAVSVAAWSGLSVAATASPVLAASHGTTRSTSEHRSGEVGDSHGRAGERARDVGTGGQRAHAQGGVPDKDWRYYGNDLGGMRYQNVDQINRSNVTRLKPAWIFHTNVASKKTSFEDQPIVVGNTMYVTSPNDHVFALDPGTGRLKWTYNPTDMPPLAKVAICCGQSNRGVAVGGGLVFLGRLDGKLVALNARTGRVAWETSVVSYKDKWSETMAPQLVGGRVIIGGSGGEFQRRGFVAAYDAASGRLDWHFSTTLRGSSWQGDSYKRGGGTMWTTPQADPQLGLVYIQAGNAAPDLNGSTRAGKNLYTDSLVALDVSTGRVRWHFQEVHHDLWDYDLAQPAILFTLHRDGQAIPVIANAEKNGFWFVFDRRDGKPVYPVHEVSVPTGPSWQHASPTQPEPMTQPLMPQRAVNVPGGFESAELFAPPRQQPLVFQPGFESGPEWGPGAYSPRTKYAYIPAGGYEPWIEHAQPAIVNSLGSTGGGFKAPGAKTYGLFDAMDTTTGKVVWQRRTPHKTVTGTVVAGDLVFFGESTGQFNAVDAKNGKLLWSFDASRVPQAGGANGSPAAYVYHGREYVVMPFGGNFRERADSPTLTSKPGDALIAFALPEQHQSTNVVVANPIPVEQGAIPPSRTFPGTARPASGATVVTLDMRDLQYHPSSFTAAPGEKISVHLMNTDAILPYSFAVGLPSGPIQLATKVKPGQSTYFTFTAPRTPGNYRFFSPGAQAFFGMQGSLTVSAMPTGGAATGDGSTAGVQNGGLLALGGAAILAAGGALAYRRRQITTSSNS